MTTTSKPVDTAGEPLQTVQQQQFETWAIAQDPPYNCERYNTGKYRMTETRAAWLVWQAACSAEKSRIVSVLDNLTLYPGTAQANILQIRGAIAGDSGLAR
jgi:hypothetical protein